MDRGDEEIVGTVTLVYDHHTRDLSDKLTEQQHSTTTPSSRCSTSTSTPITAWRCSWCAARPGQCESWPTN